MGSRVRIRSMENFFEYVFLDLTKNSKSGSHMVGTAYEFSTRDGDSHRHVNGTCRHVMEKHCRTDYQYENVDKDDKISFAQPRGVFPIFLVNNFWPSLILLGKEKIISKSDISSLKLRKELLVRKIFLNCCQIQCHFVRNLEPFPIILGLLKETC